jgi:hypothetical protein
MITSSIYLKVSLQLLFWRSQDIGKNRFRCIKSTPQCLRALLFNLNISPQEKNGAFLRSTKPLGAVASQNCGALLRLSKRSLRCSLRDL